MAKNPKVFISYSHDSPEHKQWVSELAARLRRDIVNLIFYHGNPDLDEDSTQFMESGVRDSDWVLVVCTDRYVRKANDGEGGVGYDSMIVTSKLVEELGTNKFIPIIRQTLAENKTPEFLKERAYVDFTDDTQFDAKFEELLHERLLLPPLQKPLIPYVESLRIKNYRARRNIE